jgi:hypothetical protein
MEMNGQELADQFLAFGEWSRYLKGTVVAFVTEFIRSAGGQDQATMTLFKEWLPLARTYHKETRRVADVCPQEPFVCNMEGFLESIIGHLELALQSQGLQETLTETFKALCLELRLPPASKHLLQGQIQSGAVRVLMPLQDLLRIFMHAEDEIIPSLLANHLATAVDPGATPFDILKVLPPARPKSWFWLKGPELRNFTLEGQDRTYVQAVELDTPTFNAESVRYQFHPCTIQTWSERIAEFIRTIETRCVSNFSTLKYPAAAGRQRALPYQPREYTDVPVAAGNNALKQQI